MKRVQFGETMASRMVRSGMGRADHSRKHFMLPSLLGSILLAVAALAPSNGLGALITYEGFPYPVTGPFTIDEQGGGCGWDANWGQFLGSATGYGVTNASLADPSGLLYTYSNCVYSTGGYAGRYFTVPPNWATPGFTNYFSILIRPANTPATNHFYGLQIYSNNGNTGNGVDLLVGKNGSGMNWGLEAGVGTDSYSSVSAQLNTTVLLVVRVIFSFGSPDSFALYVNPTPGQPEPAVPDATIMDDIGTQNGIQLDTGNGGHAFFDEVRLGATFASVTPTTATTCGTDPNLYTWEPFAYNQGVSTATLNGEPTDGTQGSNGWDGVSWDQPNLGSGGTNFTFLSGSLSDPSGLLVTSGNSVHAVTPQTTYQAFAGRYNVYTVLPAKTNANPTYYSVLIRPDNLGLSNGAAFFQIFGNPSGNDLYAGYLFGSPYWGLQNTTNQVLTGVPVVSNQTTFLVVRANYAPAGTPFSVLLYVNPTPGAPEPATANATYTYTQSSQQNGVALQVQNGAAATFDEIRVGTNYADVTPAVAVVTNTNTFNITSITVVSTNIVLTWKTTGGKTNVVQATAGSSGSYNTNGFTSVSTPLIIAGSGSVTTNFTDVGGATKGPSRYYRIQQAGQ